MSKTYLVDRNGCRITAGDCVILKHVPIFGCDTLIARIWEAGFKNVKKCNQSSIKVKKIGQL